MSKTENEKEFETKRRPRGPMGGGHMRMSGEKPKDFKASIKSLAMYCKRYVISILIAVILSCASSILAILGPDKLKEITNEITKGLMTGIDVDKIKTIANILVIFYACSFVFNYLQSFIMTTVTNKTSKRLRKDISSKINKLPLKYFDRHEIGDTLSRVTNDVDTIGDTLHQGVSGLVSAITINCTS